MPDAQRREPAEPGLMDRPPRPRSEGVITRRLLWRAWGLMGSLSALPVLAAFAVVLLRAGWRPGDPVGPGTALHTAYRQATTATFTGIVACQIGTAFAARTEWASLRSVGLATNRLLLLGLAGELAFTALVVYWPPAQQVFGTAAFPAWVLLLMLPFPFLVWGVDEALRAHCRRRERCARHGSALADLGPPPRGDHWGRSPRRARRAQPRAGEPGVAGCADGTRQAGRVSLGRGRVGAPLSPESSRVRFSRATSMPRKT